MRREVEGIKANMLQMVEHARSGQIQHPMQAQMLQGQMQQMAQRVLMLRERCQHVWNYEYHFELDGVFTKTVKTCSVCQAYLDSAGD